MGKRVKVVYESEKNGGHIFLEFDEKDNYFYEVNSEESVCYDCLKEDDEIDKIEHIADLKINPEAAIFNCHRCGKEIPYDSTEHSFIVKELYFNSEDRVVKWGN